jgi:hypothetical protein
MGLHRGVTADGAAATATLTPINLAAYAEPAVRQSPVMSRRLGMEFGEDRSHVAAAVVHSLRRSTSTVAAMPHKKERDLGASIALREPVVK